VENDVSHSDRDPDSHLAHELGSRLEANPAVQPLPGDHADPLARALFEYRERYGPDRLGLEPRSVEIWGSIVEQLDTPARTRFVPIRSISRWAAAAAACIVLAAGFYAWLGRDSETFVASAGPTMTVVTLKDGSTVTLRPHSSLAQTASHRYKLSGEAFFEVAKDSARTFVVETSQAELSVLGTTFDVSTWADETHVYLATGRVTITRHASSSDKVILEPGHAAIIDWNMITAPLSEAAESTYLDWLHSELSFVRTPCYRVAAELGQHFGVTLQIPSALANETLSGRIVLSSLSKGLQDLSAVLGGHFEALGDSSFVLIRD